MASVSDDEIIKKRLLIDGDAGNDEKRLTNFLRMFIRWCNSDDSPEESHISVQRMLMTLAQSDHAIQKSAQVYKMNLLEQEKYSQLNQQIGNQIQEAEQKIIGSKKELLEAKQIRKNRQEYDTMAKDIQKHPDRLGTTKKLELVAEELSQLEETKKTMEQKLDMRRKQFHVLISAIHELQAMLEEEEGGMVQEGETAKPDEMDTT
ncbi:THO complex subunit 7 homolog [Dreissena polymorpha]|uniref:THO complex subunit 7 homolog n=1 Tax=Dreissena polymorpha TaxID=45954 RepID=UPI002265012E|nr:THO complex subunit 7 homolog [Dreissena polymorpha]